MGIEHVDAATVALMGPISLGQPRTLIEAIPALPGRLNHGRIACAMRHYGIGARYHRSGRQKNR